MYDEYRFRELAAASSITSPRLRARNWTTVVKNCSYLNTARSNYGGRAVVIPANDPPLKTRPAG